MLVVMQPFNAPEAAAKVAEKILAASIAGHENNFTKAAAMLTEAVTSEDAMVYNEPRDWLLPARQYLGYALLHAGSAARAEKIFKEDLVDNPDNHWTLFGLYHALQQQKKKAEATAIKKQFDKAFEGADILPGTGFF